VLCLNPSRLRLFFKNPLGPKFIFQTIISPHETPQYQVLTKWNPLSSLISPVVFFGSGQRAA
jgi:hypothetical protein